MKGQVVRPYGFGRLNQPLSVASEVGLDNHRPYPGSAYPRNEEAGINIVRRALQSPIRQIAQNAGSEGSIIVGKFLEHKSDSYGYDAQNEEFVDMIEKGIIDPAKVLRTALQDASSVAGLLITTEAGVAEAPKKKDDGHAHGMPGGGMGGMGGMDM
jgi:chaperonin GroEL